MTGKSSFLLIVLALVLPLAVGIGQSQAKQAGSAARAPAGRLKSMAEPAGSASITLTPNTATAGVDNYVQVSGSGFTPGDVVTASYVVNQVEGGAETESSSTTPLPDGTFIGLDLPVPADAQSGTYIVTATDAHNVTATATLTITAGSGTPSTPTSSSSPTITISPNTVNGGADTTVSVSGSGFGPDDDIYISYTPTFTNGGGSTTEDAYTVADSSGSFLPTSLDVPADIAPGNYTVMAEGLTSGFTASAELTVNGSAATTVTTTPTGTNTVTATAATLTISPTIATLGVDADVTVSGTGFTPGETVSISYEPALTTGGMDLVQSTALVQSDGTFSGVSLQILLAANPGAYLVTAKGNTSGTIATAYLTIVNPITATSTTTPVPTNTLVPTATSTLTSTPTPTITSTPTSTPKPAPVISVYATAILHKVNGKEVATQAVRLGEHVTFVVAIHTENAAGLKTSARLHVTKGKQWVSGHAMTATRYDGHRAFQWTITFHKTSREGTLNALFLVSAGPADASQNLRFKVQG